MAERRSRFEQIYRQQTQAGEGTFSAIGSAARERARERADLRRLFPNTGMLGAMLESAFGKPYRAGQKGGKAGAMTGGASPLDDKSLNVIRMNTAIMAKNSMVLPGMARDMNVMRQNISRLTKHTTGSAATRADTHFLKAKEREASYESAIAKGSADKKSAVGKVAGGASSLFKSLFGGIGSFLGGTLAIGGSIISSLVSGLGSVLGIVGGVAGGILGAIGSAVSGLGIMGIIALAGAGYMISRMSKSGMFDDLSLGKLFGLAPRTDGKGLFEDTANKLDKFMNTDQFTKTLHEIKGTFAGLAAASMKVFQNMSDMMSNFLNLALQELKILFVQYSEKTLALAGAYYGGKAGLGVAGTLATLLGPGKFVKGAGLLLGATGLGAGLGAFGGKTLAENLNESLAAGDLTGRQKDVLKQMNASNLTKSYIEDYVKLRRLQEAGYGDEPVTIQFARKMGPQKYKNVQEAIDDLQIHAQHNVSRETGVNAPDFKNLEKKFDVAFGAPMTTDETYSMLAMKFKRKHLEQMIDTQKSITEGVTDAFNETKELYTGPSKATSPTSTSPSRLLKFSDLTPEQQLTLIREQRRQEGFYPGSASYDLNNPGNMVYSEQTARFGAVRDLSGRGTGDVKGKLAQFPSLAAGEAAQIDLLANGPGYRNLSLDEALKRWTGTQEKPAESANYRANIFAKLQIEHTDAINENTDAVNNLNKNLEEDKQAQFSEILAALIESMASSTTGTTVNNVNNTTVGGGNVASPYNEDMLALFKNRATVGY